MCVYKCIFVCIFFFRVVLRYADVAAIMNSAEVNATRPARRRMGVCWFVVEPNRGVNPPSENGRFLENRHVFVERPESTVRRVHHTLCQ